MSLLNLKGSFIDNLPKIYGLYTGGFVVFIGLMAIAEQFGIAAGIAGGLWLTGWMLALVLAHTPVARLAARASSDAGKIPNLLQAGSIAIAVGTLGVVVVTVWIAALVLHGPAAFRARRPAETPPESAPPPIARVSSAG